MKAAAFSILILFFASLGLKAQVEVQDEESGLMIAKVVVTIFSGENFIVRYTDDKGIVDLKPSEQFDSVVFTHPAYLRNSVVRGKRRALDPIVYMEPIVSQLPDFLIKGVRRKKSVYSGSAKIERITQRDVQLYAPQTSADLLGISDNIFVQKSQLGGGSPMMRGFSANSVLITIDGIRVNNAIFRGGNLQNVIMIDPKLIVETDVLYGPGSVAFGSDALGGVFSFQSKKPIVKPSDKMHYEGSLSLNGSSANKENSWHVDFSYGKKKWAALSSISVSNFNDLKMGSNGPDFYLRPEFVESQGLNDTIITNPDPKIQYFTSYSQINIAQKFRWEPDSTTQIDWQTTYTTSSPIPRYDRLIQYDGDTLRYANWQYGPQKWLLNALQIRKVLKSPLADELRVNIARQNTEESREYRLRNSNNFLRRTENVGVTNFNLDFNKAWKTLDFFYGIEFVGNKVKSAGTNTELDSFIKSEIASRYPDNSTWNSIAAYTMATKELNKRTELQIGARYTQVSLKAPFNSKFYSFPFDEISMNNGALNASLGINYKINSKNAISLNVASGFRAPNIDDIGKIFDSEEGKVVIPNADLIPEYAYTADIGWRGKIGESLKVLINGYYTIIDNLVMRDNLPFNGQDSLLYDGQLLETQSLVNSGSGYIYGIEAQIKYRLSNNFQANASYNYIRGESENGNPIRHVTPAFGKAGVSYLKQNLKIELFARFQEELAAEDMAITERNKPFIYLTNSDGLPYSPSWWTLNIKGTYNMSKSLLFMSGIENVLDKRYRPYSSGITAPGFNFYFGIKNQF